MEFYKYLLLNFNIKTTFGIISKEHAVSKAKKMFQVVHMYICRKNIFTNISCSALNFANII